VRRFTLLSAGPWRAPSARLQLPSRPGVRSPFRPAFLQLPHGLPARFATHACVCRVGRAARIEPPVHVARPGRSPTFPPAGHHACDSACLLGAADNRPPRAVCTIISPAALHPDAGRILPSEPPRSSAPTCLVPLQAPTRRPEGLRITHGVGSPARYGSALIVADRLPTRLDAFSASERLTLRRRVRIQAHCFGSAAAGLEHGHIGQQLGCPQLFLAAALLPLPPTRQPAPLARFSTGRMVPSLQPPSPGAPCRSLAPCETQPVLRFPPWPLCVGFVRPALRSECGPSGGSAVGEPRTHPRLSTASADLILRPDQLLPPVLPSPPCLVPPPTPVPVARPPDRRLFRHLAFSSHYQERVVSVS